MRRLLSRMVTRLVRMGLLTRTRSTTSNREVVVTLSAKGNALVARLIPLLAMTARYFRPRFFFGKL